MAYEPGDLAIKIDGHKLNIRAAGVIIHNGKILLHKGETANHYALLGGHVRLGENSQDTVKREIQEELGKKIEITGKGLLAQALSHEIDHLNGEVFIDKIIPGTLEIIKPEK